MVLEQCNGYGAPKNRFHRLNTVVRVHVLCFRLVFFAGYVCPETIITDTERGHIFLVQIQADKTAGIRGDFFRGASVRRNVPRRQAEIWFIHTRF